MQYLENASQGRVLMVLLTCGNCLRIRHMKKVVRQTSESLMTVGWMNIEISDGPRKHCLQVWVNGRHISSSERSWGRPTDILEWLEETLKGGCNVEYDGGCAISELSAEKPVLVIYYGDWCERSLRLKKMAEKIQEICEVMVATVDIETYRREASIAGAPAPPLIQLWDDEGVVSTFSGQSWPEEIAHWVKAKLGQNTATTVE